MDDGINWERLFPGLQRPAMDMTPMVHLFRDIRAVAASDAEAVAVMTAIIGGMANVAPPKGAAAGEAVDGAGE